MQLVVEDHALLSVIQFTTVELTIQAYCQGVKPLDVFAHLEVDEGGRDRE